MSPEWSSASSERYVRRSTRRRSTDPRRRLRRKSDLHQRAAFIRVKRVPSGRRLFGLLRWQTNERGAALVEFAIIGVPLVLMMFGGLVFMLDQSKLSIAWQQIEFASEATAKCISTNNPPNCPPTDPASYAASLVHVVTVLPSTFTISPNQPCGNKVDASYTYIPMWMQSSYFAEFLPASVPVTASACYP